MSDQFSIQDKTILVTGGTRGIGKAITSALVQGGASVIVNYVRDRKSADALLSELGEDKVTMVRADLTRNKGMDALLEAVNGRTLDALVHSAATGVFGPVKKLTLRQWDWTMDLNVRAFFDLITRLQDQFTSTASVIALSSEGAVKAVPNYSLVGASKGALESLCRHLGADMYARGIRFNILSPGSVITDSWKAFPDQDTRIEMVKRKIPGGEMTTLDEIASVAVFLCSDASKGINGQTLVVDRGERIVI